MEPPVLNVARSATGRAWRWRSAPLALDNIGADLAARLMLSRGAATQDLSRLLKPTLREWLPDPSAFRDMDAAADRLAEAVRGAEKITLFTDYDVDGATSAAILVRALAGCGAGADVYVPDRLLEGYGPSLAAIRTLAESSTRLLLLLDCGTQAFAEIAEARALGMDVIVVDHHKASTELPAASALVNPNRFDEQADAGTAAAHGTLCTAGLSFLLAVALRRALRARGHFAAQAEPELSDLLDLVALGTVADVMPLSGLNRAFVALGLGRLATRSNPGLAALLDIAGLSGPPQASDLGFHLGPRVNAGGRVGTADLGVRLLTTADPTEARALAEALDAHNRERRAIEAAVTEAALARADRASPILVVAGEGWHPGVIGIVAGRLKERLGRPAVVIATDGAAPAKGSARSVAGFDIGAAILAAKDAGLLLAGGGHAMAAGLTIATDRIPALEAFLTERLAAAPAAAAATPTLAIDLAVSPRALDLPLADALDAAGPYGEGWPAPRLALGPVRLHEAMLIGQTQETLRLVGIGPDGARVKAIAFRAAGTPLGQALLETPRGRMLHLAGRAARNHWQGKTSLDLHLDDAAPAD
jgi:single-stranded-DNA-specific exonuclease